MSTSKKSSNSHANAPFSSSSTSGSISLLRGPFYHDTFEIFEFWFYRLASFTGLDLPAPTSAIWFALTGSWKAHYFILMSNGSWWVRLEYGPEGVSFTASTKKEELLNSTDHQDDEWLKPLYNTYRRSGNAIADWINSGSWQATNYDLTNNNCQKFCRQFRLWL